MKKKIIMIVLGVIAILALIGIYQNNQPTDQELVLAQYEQMMKEFEEACSAAEPAEPAFYVDEEDYPIAYITIEDYGTMTFELYPNDAPQSVYNFIYLAESGYYDGLTIHRLIPGFVIQGGDPEGNGSGGPGYSIEGEFCSNNIANDLTHEKGSIAWARSSSPNSAGSQFYINFDDNDSLDGDYAVFGYMIDGWEVLEELESVETDENDKPVEPLIIESITVDTKGIEYPEPNKL